MRSEEEGTMHAQRKGTIKTNIVGINYFSKGGIKNTVLAVNMFCHETLKCRLHITP